MTDERLSIKEIILAWRDKYGVSVTSERGKTYTEISRTNREEHLRYLHSTLLSYGYTAKEMTDPYICFFIAELCWSKKIQKLSKSVVQERREEDIDTWKGICLRKVVSFNEDIEIKKVEKKLPPVEINEYVEPQEKEFDLEESLRPVKYIQDNPKYDTSDLEPIKPNLDLLAKLNALKATLGNKK